MEKLIYCDTNFYLDYFENRKDRLRPLGDFAFEIIKRAIECEFRIIISDLVVYELEKYISKDKIEEFIKTLEKRKKCDLVLTEEKNERDARELKKKYEIHFQDCLHYVLALNNRADILVTNDRHFFELPQKGIAIRNSSNINL